MNQSEGRWPIWGTTIAVVLAFFTAGMVMFQVDPFHAGQLEKVLFFFSFFMGLWGLSALIIFSIRRFLSKHLLLM